MFNLKQVGNSFIYVLSDVFVKALPFFLIPIITRYLTVEEYGEVSLAQTCIEVFTIVFVFGTHHYYRYEFFKGSVNKELLFLVPIIVSLCIFFLVFLLVFLVTLFLDEVFWWYLLVPVAALFQSLISLFICKFQTIEKPFAVGFTNLSLAILSFVFTVLFLFNGLGVDGRLFVVLFTPILIGGLCVIYIFRKYELEKLYESRFYFKEGIKFGSKAFPSSISWWLRSGMDRILLQYMIGLSAVGVFSIAVQFSLVITVIASAINNAVMPSIFRSVNSQQYKIVFKMIVFSVAIVTLFALLLVLVSPVLIKFVLPEQYQLVGDYFIPLIIASVLHACFLFTSNVLVAEKKVAKLSTISLLSSLSHLMISIVMIKYYGLDGLVWSGVISYGISVIVLLSSCIRARAIK
ncbi:oligosaccharide flippase family protein [Vibrio breoganii]